MSRLRSIGEIAELVGELRRQTDEHMDSESDGDRRDWLDRAASYLSAAEAALDEACE